MILGPMLGEQVGIRPFGWLAIRSGHADMPKGVHWFQLWGVSALACIGFTMSIFIADLASLDPDPLDEAKVGSFVASLAPGIVGYALLQKALYPEA